MERLFENLESVKHPKLPGTLCLDPIRAVYSTPYEPPAARGQCAGARWVMVYGHKTQSFMKNGGHQKCLDKALFEIIGFHNSKYFLNVLFKNLIANWCWNRVYLYWFTAMILSIVNHIPLQLDNSFTQQKAPQLILSWKDFLADFLFEP